MRARHPLIVMVAAGAAAVGGCTMVAPAPDPTVVTLFHVDGVSNLDPTVDWFAQEVRDLSGGELKIEVVRACCGDDNLMEETLVKKVADGETPLGWVGTRVLGDLGVHELDALTAPMFIDDYALQQQVATSDAATESLAALDRLGVRGLAVMPGPLRHPLTADAPVLTLADWDGRTIGVFHSPVTYEGLEAMGADPWDVSVNVRDQSLFSGSISGIENSLLMLDDHHEAMTPYATTNLVLAPRMSVLIAPPDLADRLTADEIAVLEQAAADVVGKTGMLSQVDQDALESACSSGARFAEASATDLQDMRDAVAGVYADLDADAAAGPLYRAIVELKADRGPAAAPSIPDECRGRAHRETSWKDVALLDGFYESPDLSETDLRALGLSAQEARAAEGVYRVAFDTRGGFWLELRDPFDRVSQCNGEYTVDGDRVTIALIAGDLCHRPGGPFLTADFAYDLSVEPKQLTFSNVVAPVASDEQLFGRYPFTWVGY